MVGRCSCSSNWEKINLERILVVGRCSCSSNWERIDQERLDFYKKLNSDNDTNEVSIDVINSMILITTHRFQLSELVRN